MKCCNVNLHQRQLQQLPRTVIDRVFSILELGYYAGFRVSEAFLTIIMGIGDTLQFSIFEI